MQRAQGPDGGPNCFGNLTVFFDRFRFFDPGPLIDHDLELIPPRVQLIDDVLKSCQHPLTRCQAPAEAQVTRTQLEEFLELAPEGREPANPSANRVPQYHFWMRRREEFSGQSESPPLSIVGGISLRIAWTPSVELYYGHIGYHVYPAAQGRHYAERACRMLLPLARRHKIRTLWITCNPENAASRRTCERLGARLVEIVPVPPEQPLFARGEFFKCRYRLDVPRRQTIARA